MDKSLDILGFISLFAVNWLHMQNKNKHVSHFQGGGKSPCPLDLLLGSAHGYG